MITKETARDLLQDHYQHRENSCFQSGPEMALKLAGILGQNEFPFQSHPEWDGHGYEPYGSKFSIGENTVQFEVQTNHRPYGEDFFSRLATELEEGRFPVLSLREDVTVPWHGYVVFAKEGDDFLIVTKQSPDSLGRTSLHEIMGRLRPILQHCDKVDCLFYTAAPSVDDGSASGQAS